jgi:hypothetical protein
MILALVEWPGLWKICVLGPGKVTIILLEETTWEKMDRSLLKHLLKPWFP